MNPARFPASTPETAHFWDGVLAGELRLQRCEAAQHVYFPPRPVCPVCGDRAVTVFRASGRASLWSFVAMRTRVFAIIELAEGPRLFSQVVDYVGDPEALALDMPLDVVFRPIIQDGPDLPLFRPSGDGGAS